LPPAPTANADGSASVPLCAKDGSIRAYAAIDIDDAAWASQWRWFLNIHGYAARHDWDGTTKTDRTVMLHRELLGLAYGDRRRGDHINRDRLNNRRSNLRLATHAENMQNKNAYRGGTSHYRGVCWNEHTRKWQASLRVNGKSINLGGFADELEAAEAARSARARLMPHAID